MNPIHGFLFVIFVSIVTVVGDFFIKLAGNTAKYIDFKYFFYGMFLYLLTGVGWFFAMKKIELSSIGVIYGVTTGVFLAVIGVLFFHENINYIELIAIALGVASIFMLIRFAS